MVEVGVGQDDRVEVRRVEAERDPVADRLVGAALEHPAIDQDPRPVGLDQELGAGDGRGATEEVDLHGRHGDRPRGRRDIAAPGRCRAASAGFGWPQRPARLDATTSASTAIARNSSDR